jgi:predicted alpha-1,6-mannanase (GH76 family)
MLVFALALCGLGHQAASHPPGRAAAQRIQGTARATLTVKALQRHYAASSYAAAHWWESANALEATIDYMRASGSREFISDLDQTYHAHHDRDGFRNSFYDDEGWWALAWIDAYDLTRSPEYLRQAQDIFADMTGGWDGTCGGGIWWSKARHYKNAIANELFLQVAIGLHNRTPGDTGYAEWPGSRAPACSLPRTWSSMG